MNCQTVGRFGMAENKVRLHFQTEHMRPALEDRDVALLTQVSRPCRRARSTSHTTHEHPTFVAHLALSFSFHFSRSAVWRRSRNLTGSS
jgi:hypothetical protein